MCFKKLKALMVIVLVIMLVFSTSAFAAPKKEIVYTALGDSIAYGTGATDDFGYTYLLNEHFNKQFGKVTYNNLSYDGMTSENLILALDGEPNDDLELLLDGSTLQDVIINSDVITISIGGNDLLGPFRGAFERVIEWYYTNPDSSVDLESLLLDLAEWELDPTTHAHFSAMLIELSGSMPLLIPEFGSNWNHIIEQIRDLNPHADIYVNTVFNPFKFSPSLYQFADPVIQALNAPIYSLVGVYDYKVVDVYSKFEEYGNSNKLIVGDMSTYLSALNPAYTGQTPLHPTDMGYKFILNMHKDLMD